MSKKHTSVTPRWLLRLLWIATRRRKFRPIWQADLVANDLLGQARFLFDAGYLIAAGMLTRSYVERSLKRLSLISSTWKECKARTAPELIQFLQNNDAIDGKTGALASHIYKNASKICHTGKASKPAVVSLLRDAKAYQRRFDDAMTVALNRAE